MDLFSSQEAENRERNKPLAARMRPRSLSEFSGQSHFLGEGKLLRRLIDARRLTSLIFFGPPGTGKTTLAHLIAHSTQTQLKQLNAVTSGVKELREILAWANQEVATGGPRPILFVDEIHRFNKSQQDALLPDVEQGIVTLIGATTSNPFFSVNGALLSRSQLFQFHALTTAELAALIERAISDKSRGLGAYHIEASKDAIEHLAEAAEGDARRALSILEIAVLSSKNERIALTKELINDSMQQKTLQYDGTGDEHYDITSALIKSIRGSDPDAALYWLARMLEAGDDIRFICRRLVILASEDIGNADPHALPLATAAHQACEFVGLPECQLILSQAVIYLSCAPKSNAATRAIGAALKEVREGKIIPVPMHLRDAHYDQAEQLGHGEGYIYAHDVPGGVAAQDYLGVERIFYEPTDRGWEGTTAKRLADIRATLSLAKKSTPPSTG